MPKFFGEGSDCSFCRMMRSMAFSGLGAAIGGGVGSLLGLQRADIWLCAIGGAFVMVFLVLRKLENS